MQITFPAFSKRGDVRLPSPGPISIIKSFLFTFAFSIILFFNIMSYEKL